MGFKVQSPKSKVLLLAAAMFLLLTAHCSLLTSQAHEGEDHSKDNVKAQATTQKSAVAVAKAERNVQTAVGQFNVRLERVPADPRDGETVQMALALTEKVEGGFGANEPLALNGAAVVLNVTTADGRNVADNLPAKFENGFYRAAHAFGGAGNYKAVFDVTTADNRKFAADFPVAVASAPVNWTFWIGTTVLALLSFGAIGTLVYKSGRGAGGKENVGSRAIKIAPFAIAAGLFFAFATFALARFAPPRQTRQTSNFQPSGSSASANHAETADANTRANLTVSKESQLLFGIKTELIQTRAIASGLKTTGVVRACPDARGVVVPPVAGKIVLRSGLTIGSAVARGERIGTVEQILDVSGQTELESQRLEVEAQTRETEARRLEIRNSVLVLQSSQAEQRAAAQTARTRLAQANRELKRAENLVEVGAVPRRRVEEAQTAVRVAEQEIAAAEQQTKLLDQQIRQASGGERIFGKTPSVRQAVRAFPLTAPVAGIVGEIRATSGQQVEAGTELLTIVNLATVLLEAQVFEKDLPAVRESTTASFTAAALNNEVYRIGGSDGDGRLVSIGQTVNPETRTVPVVYEIKNPLQRLRDNNFVEITIETGGGEKVLAVPKQAVVSEQGQTFVFVFLGGESFERRAVALTQEGAEFYEVKSGVKEGERIVTEGVYQLRSTQPGT